MIKIYAFGSNGSGQLAIGHKSDVSMPERIQFLDNHRVKSVKQIKAGGNHALLLNGESLYISGTIGDDSSKLIDTNDKFIRLQLFDDTDNILPVIYCTACWEVSVIVQRDENRFSDKLYTIGVGNHGELGQGEKLTTLARAKLLQKFPPPGLKVNDIASSVSHIVVVLNNGDVYGWGNGRKGQIGEPRKIIHEPRKVTGLSFKVTRAVCGQEFTCLFGDPKDGYFTILGSNKWGIISSAPCMLPSWKDVGAGWGSIHVLKSDGKLVSWGRNDYRQLAPHDLPELSKIAVGSEHVLGLTLDGDVLAWGWGEHGNCGSLTPVTDVGSTFNIIKASDYLGSNGKFIGIAAGCATSWIYGLSS